MSSHVLSDTGALTGRSLRHILRSPDTEHQPVTAIVDTIRALFAQEPTGNDIWVALAWIMGILVVAHAVAIATYHRKAS